MAAEELQEEFPEAKVITVDTLCASMGQGLLVDLAVQEKRKGKDIEAVRDFVRETIPHLCHWFTVGDLSQLRRGGRLSAGKAIVGNLLNIKPVLHVDDQGHLVPMESAKGRKKSIEALLKHMEESAIDPQNQRIYISHGDCLDEARALAAMIQERLHVVSVTIGDVGPVIGAHSGLGTLALFFSWAPNDNNDKVEKIPLDADAPRGIFSLLIGKHANRRPAHGKGMRGVCAVLQSVNDNGSILHHGL